MIVMFFDKIRNVFIWNSMVFLSFFYEKIYKEPMNEEVKIFLKNLSFVGLGTILSTIFSFLFNIFAGRMLGPSGYGSFTLVQSIAMMLYLPMLLGFNTVLIKYCAETTNHDRLSSIISTSYISVVILTVVSLIIYLIFINQEIAFFSVNREIIWLSIIFAVLFVFYTMTISTLRGLHLMEEFALFQPIFGFTLLSTFFIFMYIQPPSFEAMVYANYLAFGIIGCIIVIIFLKKYFMVRVDRLWLSTAWRYSNFALIGGLAFTLYSNIDRILINYYMDVESVGIYGVYYYAAFAVIGLVSGVFITVFFPMASKPLDRKSIYRKLNKTIPYLLILGIPGTIISEFIILHFFGAEYPINFPLMIIFAISAVLVTWYTLYAWFFNSEGVNGARLTVSGTLIIAIVNVVLNIILIPRIGLYGSIGATAIAFVFGLCYNYYFGRKFFGTVEFLGSDPD
jgi:O-antigen/teichoic acid export membrane protein